MNDRRSERFRDILAEVEQTIGKRLAHRIAIYVLKERTRMSVPMVADEAGSATNDHAMLALVWTRKEMERDSKFADKVRRLVKKDPAEAGRVHLAR